MKKIEQWTNVDLNDIGVYIQTSPDLHTRRRLLQYQEATCAMEAEMAVGVRTVVEMRANSRGHKLCEQV